MSDRDPLGIVGTLVADKYRVEKLVGEGGFAVVYRAMHTIWNKPVAIKFFNGLSSASRRPARPVPAGVHPRRRASHRALEPHGGDRAGA